MKRMILILATLAMMSVGILAQQPPTSGTFAPIQPIESSALIIDAQQRCGGTGSKTLDREYASAQKLFTAKSSIILTERECLIAQWFFGQGARQGAAMARRYRGKSRGDSTVQ